MILKWDVVQFCNIDNVFKIKSNEQVGTTLRVVILKKFELKKNI
jgi:hypothetical protein